MMKRKLNLRAARNSEARDDTTRLRSSNSSKSPSSPLLKSRTSRSHSPPNSFRKNRSHRRLLSSPVTPNSPKSGDFSGNIGTSSSDKMAALPFRRNKSLGDKKVLFHSLGFKKSSDAADSHDHNDDHIVDYSYKSPHQNESNVNANNHLSDSSGSDDDASIETQESAYIHRVDAPSSPIHANLQSDYGRYNTSNRARVTCYAYKRKSGFSGKLKKKYAVASEKGKHHLSNQLEFWKAGAAKMVGSSVNDHSIDEAHMQSKQDSTTSNVKMWERRRIVLEGRLLMYYHEDAALEEDEAEEVTPSAPTGTSAHPHTLMRLKKKFNDFAEHANPLKMASQPDINTPRGVIDIIDSHATASIIPISPHSFAPTPYCLAIHAKSDAKWVLCFTSEREVVKWLNIFTNVSLKESMLQFQKHRGNKRPTAKSRNLRQNLMIDGPRLSIEPLSANDTRKDDLSAELLKPNVKEGTIGENEDRNSKRSIFCKFDDTFKNADSYKVFALVNSAFFLLAMENTLFISHPLAIIVVNTLTWVHLRGVAKKTAPPDTLMEEIATKEHKSAENSETSDDLQYNPPGVNEISMKDEGRISPIRRQVSVSNSYVEMGRSLDEDDNSIYRPCAGKSTIHLESIPTQDNGESKTTWVSGDPSIIDLRGPDYLTSKRKIPSPTSLYELVYVDAFDSNEHMTDVGQRFQCPTYDYGAVGAVGNWCAPDTLIISFALPTSPAKLRATSNGKGYIVCGYYRIRPEVRQTLDIISNPNHDEKKREAMLKSLFPESNKRMLVNGVRLWEKWCKTAKTDPEMQKRLKFIPRGENLRELGVPSWICRYNGKPMLIKRPGETSFIFSHPYDRTLEIDINLHPLPFMFKQAMTYLKDNYFPRMIMTFGFLIEGREEDELPEVLLGNPIQLPFCNPNRIMKADDVFSGDQASF